MTADAFCEKIVQRKLSLGVVLGAALVAIAVVLTLLLQYWEWIDILTNLTELWLFVIALPALSVALTLIVRGLSAPRVLAPQSHLQARSAKGMLGVPRLLELVKDGGDMKVIGTEYSRWANQSYEAIKSLIIQKNVGFTFLVADPHLTVSKGQLTRVCLTRVRSRLLRLP